MHKKIMVSGGNGNIAKSLAKYLEDVSFIMLGRNKEKLQDIYKDYTNILCYSYDDLFRNAFSLEDIDLFIHGAFERSENTENLVKSLDLSSKIFQIVQNSEIKSIINISSMSAYSFKTEEPGIEKKAPNPTNFYGLAKVASEILMDTIFKNKNITNIRLAALSGSIYEKHILTTFVRNALTKKVIEITGGSQQFCFMDARDAIEALCILINSNPTTWEKIYNISDNTQYNIVFLANKVIEVLKNKYKIKAKLKLKKTKQFYFSFSLDSNKFMEAFNWKPKYTLEDTINEIIENLNSSLNVIKVK